MRRKIAIIRQHQVLQDIIGTFKTESENSLESDDYLVVPCDLTDLKKLDVFMEKFGIDFNVPSLFFSECVLTYVDLKHSKNLIGWIQKRFQQAAVVIYEQIRPDDAFGYVMMRHFDKIQSPLRRIKDLFTIQKHREVFEALNYSNVLGFDMNFFYEHYLDECEKGRMIRLELFDEFEEWHLKCSHYCIIAAFTGLLTNCNLPARMFPYYAPPEDQPPQPLSYTPTTLNEEQLEVKRFGHRCVQLTNNQFLCMGGFGVTPDGGHKRLNTGLLINSNDVPKCTQINELDDVLYNSITRLSDNRFFVLGGRKSPKTTIPKYGIFVFDGNLVCPVVTKDAETQEEIMVVSRWRHSAVLFKGQILLFGGVTTDNRTLNDLWCIDVNGLTVRKISTTGDVELFARHSHTMSVWKKENVVVYGGLEHSMHLSNQMLLLSLKDGEYHIKEMKFQVPLPKRYAHTSHVVNDTMIVVGGVDTSGQFSTNEILLIDLIGRTFRGLKFPACNPASPLMFHNHQSLLLTRGREGCEKEGRLLVVGGGGNCFSFGTHFNRCVVSLDLSDEIKLT
eukprot:TCONS_00071053-protein